MTTFKRIESYALSEFAYLHAVAMASQYKAKVKPAVVEKK